MLERGPSGRWVMAAADAERWSEHAALVIPGRTEGRVAKEQRDGATFVLPASDLGSESPWARPANGGLPRWRLKRVVAYIDDNIARDISLDDLAGVARLSAHHFSEL